MADVRESTSKRKEEIGKRAKKKGKRKQEREIRKENTLILESWDPSKKTLEPLNPRILEPFF
jgi:hypothetical protein